MLPPAHNNQRLVFGVSVVVLALIILGAGGIYAAYLLNPEWEQEPPPAVTLVLGAALVQLAGIVREGTQQVVTNGIKTTSEETNIGVKNANTKLDDAKAELVENGDSVKARQEKILEELAKLRKERE